MCQGQFSPHRLQSSPLIPLFFSSPPQMSPLSRQSTIFLHAKLAEELNSESSWADGVVSSAFYDDAFHTFDSTPTTTDPSQDVLTHNPLLSFEDDHLDPLSTPSGGSDRADFTDPTPDAWAVPYSDTHNDLYATFSLFTSLSSVMTDHISSFVP